MSLQKKAEPEATAERKPVQFFCKAIQYTFHLDKTGPDGKPVFATDKDGNNKHREYESFSFERVPVADIKHPGKTDPTQFLCTYIVKADDPRYAEKVEYLTKQCSNAISGMMTADTCHAQQNPGAFAESQKVKEKDIEIEQLKKDLAEQRALVDSLTKP